MHFEEDEEILAQLLKRENKNREIFSSTSKAWYRLNLRKFLNYNNCIDFSSEAMIYL